MNISTEEYWKVRDIQDAARALIKDLRGDYYWHTIPMETKKLVVLLERAVDAWDIESD